ncbi:MAG: ABC transporter substrate-binding protein [Deltaproteobacteria bacterium]|nr:ABC transporter substrate-binding protein [Deltaproteobacteria bacterium]
MNHCAFRHNRAFCILLLASCSSPAARDEASFWYSYGGRNREVLEDLVGRFNRVQAREGRPGRIRGTFQGDYFDALAKLRAAMLARRAPAVTHVIAEALPRLAESGVLEDLGPWARGPEPLDTGDIVPALSLSGTFDLPGDVPLVAIPFNRSTPILYYDREALQRAGIEPPRTWDDLRQAAHALTVRRGGHTERWGLTCPLSWWFWYAALAQANGTLLTPDGRAAFGRGPGVEALELYLGMVRAGTMRLPPGHDYAAWEKAHADFIARRAAMVITSTAFLAYITDNARFAVGAAPLPGHRRRAVPTGGTFFVLLADAPARAKRTAWSFVRWMSEPSRTAEWARRTGYLPVRRSAVDSEAMQRLYRERPAFRVALDQLDERAPFPWTSALLAIEREAVQPALERAAAGEVSAAEAMAEAARVADQRILELR